MLSRRTYRGFVCLNCRLRIAGSITSRRLSSYPPLSLANKSNFFEVDNDGSWKKEGEPSSSDDPFSRLLIEQRAEARPKPADSKQQQSNPDRASSSAQNSIPASREAANTSQRSGGIDPLDGAEPLLWDSDSSPLLKEIGEEHGEEHGRVQGQRENKNKNWDGRVRRMGQRPRRTFGPTAPRPLPKPKRTYKANGQLLAAEEEDLQIGILGEPAHAIVLRDQGPLKKRPTREIVADPDAPSEGGPQFSKNLAELLENESIDPTLDEALRNIHSLRMSNGEVLLDSVFKQLQTSLVEGFKKDQLEAYVSRYRSTVQSRRRELDPPWVLENTGWVPVSEGREEEHENRKDAAHNSAMQGYLVPGMRPKERLAVRLLRECWGLSSWDVANRQGYLNVKLRETEFALLLLGSKRWLDEIARSFLGPGKQIELICARNVVSILAPKALAEVALDKINDALHRAKTVHFAVDLVSQESLNPAILEEVGRITNTLVRLDSSKKEIVVTWVQEPNHSEELEDLGDAVLRFLLLAYGPRHRHKTDLVVWPAEASGTSGGRYVISNHSEDRMAWKNRGRPWARWTSPVARRWDQGKIAGSHSQLSDSPSPSPDLLLPEALLLHPITPGRLLPVQLEDDASRNRQLSHDWSPFVYTATTATFGHVLQERTAPIAANTAPQAFDKSLERIFVPVVPPLANLNLGLLETPREGDSEGEGEGEDITQSQPETTLSSSLSSSHTSTLVLRFLPAPDQTALPADTITAAPTLEVRLEVTNSSNGNEQIGALLGVRAIVDSYACDLILPAAPVDVRLQQIRFFELLPHVLPVRDVDVDANHHHDQSDNPYAPLLDFLATAVLRPAEGDLRTPARLRGIRIPTRLMEPFREVGSPTLTGEQQQQQTPSSSSVEEGVVEQEEQGTTREDDSKPGEIASSPPLEEEKDGESSVMVDYLFAALEMQRSATVRWEGFSLVYTSVEAGQRGGRRAELALDAQPHPPPQPQSQPQVAAADSDNVREDGSSAFVAAVTKLVLGEGQHRWQGQNPWPRGGE